jgi:hypothetical protein
MSTSPERRAATRVASLAITLNSTRVRLCSARSHQLGFGTSTVRRSGSREESMKGPVPMALRVAKFSSREVRSATRAALLRSSHALLITPKEVRLLGRIGSGWRVTISMVKSSTFRTSATEAKKEPTLEPGPRARAMENSTSSAVRGEPSLNFTPSRSLKRQVVGFTCSQDVASAGSRPRLRSRRISGS